MKKFLSIIFFAICVVCIFNGCKHETEKEIPAEIYTIPLGDYQDTLSERATMTISFKNKVYCFEINWSSSASENTKWVFSGVYDPTIGGVRYDNSICINELYDETGNGVSKEEYNGGKGKMIYKANELLWMDEQEERYFVEDYNCVFKKIEIENEN